MAGLPDMGDCERNPRCSRGFKHGGFGGHCSLRPDGCERTAGCTRGFKHGGAGGRCSFLPVPGKPGVAAPQARSGSGGVSSVGQALPVAPPRAPKPKRKRPPAASASGSSARVNPSSETAAADQSRSKRPRESGIRKWSGAAASADAGGPSGVVRLDQVTVISEEPAAVAAATAAAAAAAAASAPAAGLSDPADAGACDGVHVDSGPEGRGGGAPILEGGPGAPMPAGGPETPMPEGGMGGAAGEGSVAGLSIVTAASGSSTAITDGGGGDGIQLSTGAAAAAPAAPAAGIHSPYPGASSSADQAHVCGGNATPVGDTATYAAATAATTAVSSSTASADCSDGGGSEGGGGVGASSANASASGSTSVSLATSTEKVPASGSVHTAILLPDALHTHDLPSGASIEEKPASDADHTSSAAPALGAASAASLACEQKPPAQSISGSSTALSVDGLPPKLDESSLSISNGVGDATAAASALHVADSQPGLPTLFTAAPFTPTPCAVAPFTAAPFTANIVAATPLTAAPPLTETSVTAAHDLVAFRIIKTRVERGTSSGGSPLTSLQPTSISGAFANGRCDLRNPATIRISSANDHELHLWNF